MNQPRLRRPRKRLLAAMVSVLALPSVAQPSEQRVETVVVTGRKVPEPAQTVPFGITSLDAEDLELRRVADFDSFARLVPNLAMTNLRDGRSSFFGIRGVGSIALPVSTDDASVVVYIDEVPQLFFASDARFLDIERIEVLRGPQGVLFGRNAQAGAIHIVTRKPGKLPEAEVLAEAGSGSHGLLRLRGNVPLAQGFGLRLAAHASHAGDYIDNVIPGGQGLGRARSQGVRASVGSVPGASSGTSGSWRLDAQAASDLTHPTYLLSRSAPGAPITAVSPGRENDRQTRGLALTLTRPVGDLRLTSISSLSTLRNDLLTDDTDGFVYGPLFGQPVDAFTPFTDYSRWRENDRGLNQELRLDGGQAGGPRWVAGLNVYRNVFRFDYDNGSSFSPVLNGFRSGRLSLTSVALFGELNQPIGPKGLSGFLGLRASNESKRYESRYRSNGFAGTVEAFEQAGALSDRLLTGRTGLSWELGQDTTLHALVARGAKSGGFPRFVPNASLGVPAEPYRASHSWTYEVGSKSRLLGGRASTAVSVFFNDVRDEQLFTLNFANFSFFPVNLDTRSHGIELEGTIKLASSLELRGAVGYTDARMRRLSVEAAALSGAREGGRVPNVPRLNTSLDLVYTTPVSGVAGGTALLNGSVGWQYVGRRAADVGNTYEFAANHMINARLGLQFGRAEWFVFGSNLADEQPQSYGVLFGPGAETAAYGRGRVFGAGVNVKF